MVLLMWLPIATGKGCNSHLCHKFKMSIYRSVKMINYLKAGQKFGKLTVIKLEKTKTRIYNCSLSKSGKRKLNLLYYLCKCDCGNYTVIEKSHLTKKFNNTKTCGCSNGTHHKRNTRLYHIFHDMKKRCYNPNSKSYKDYGGRGIKICKEWLYDFMSFYNWATSNGYNDNLTIERINVNKDYQPSNCKWITFKEQARNKRNTVYLIHNGYTDSLVNWSEKLNIPYKTLKSRYENKTKWFKNNFKVVL